jgi:hypothetical protein
VKVRWNKFKKFSQVKDEFVGNIEIQVGIDGIGIENIKSDA